MKAAQNIIKMMRQIETIKLYELKRCTEGGKDNRVATLAI